MNTTIGLLPLLLLWSTAPALAQAPWQVRVTGTCPAGSSIRVINANGSVVCEPDDNSGGTVTSVGTGSGLTGGPITATGTISIAPGGVTSSHIVDGAIGAVDINANEIQRRVEACPAGSSIRAIGADGTVTCENSGGVAWARVNADGSLDTANSKNVSATSLFEISGNYYCIDVAVPFKNIQVTPATIAPVFASALVGDPFTSCAPFNPGEATGDVTVQTFNAAGLPTPSAFFILFH